MFLTSRKQSIKASALLQAKPVSTPFTQFIQCFVIHSCSTWSGVRSLKNTSASWLDIWNSWLSPLVWSHSYWSNAIKSLYPGVPGIVFFTRLLGRDLIWEYSLKMEHSALWLIPDDFMEASGVKQNMQALCRWQKTRNVYCLLTVDIFQKRMIWKEFITRIMQLTSISDCFLACKTKQSQSKKVFDKICVSTKIYAYFQRRVESTSNLWK